MRCNLQLNARRLELTGIQFSAFQMGYGSGFGTLLQAGFSCREEYDHSLSTCQKETVELLGGPNVNPGLSLHSRERTCYRLRWSYRHMETSESVNGATVSTKLGDFPNKKKSTCLDPTRIQACFNPSNLVEVC